MRKYLLVLVALFFTLRCAPVPDVGRIMPMSSNNAVDHSTFWFRVADDGSRVYWQCKVSNRTTGFMTATIQPAVQVMEAETMAGLKTKYGTTWDQHWNTVEGSAWVSQEPSVDVILDPGQTKTVKGEIMLPERCKNKRMEIVNRTMASAECSAKANLR